MDITCPLCGQPTPTPADILATRATCVRCGQSFALDALPTMVPVAATPAPANPAESLAGRRLGGCRLIRVIGRGGMGEVYEAVQESLNRKVAVKVLPPGLAKDEAFIKRFNRESGALAQLSHPHIVAIYDRGCEDGHYYFVLEHVEGPGGSVAETLHSRLRNGPALAPGDCSRLMLQITEALAYAHGKGVIHRDIKPSNILLDARGQARLVDFGIARLVDAGPVEDHQLTLTGEVLGTTGYLAPEQREGRKDVDGRADIYSCGVMLYQMLTGRMPEGVFELPSEVVHGLPPAWDAAVEMALHRNPERRCPSMAAFLQAIRAVADGQAPPSRLRPSERLASSPTAEVRSPDTNAQRTPVVGKCAKCGTVNAGDNRFCVECGVNLYEGCPACNAENRIGIKFCGQCGVDIVRHRRRADQRAHALALAARAGSLPAGAAVPLWREACQVWTKLLAEVPDDAAGQTARHEAQNRFSSAVLSQVQELNEQARSQPADAAVPLLRQSDKLLAELLAEIPGSLPARTGREELQRLIPARWLQATEALLEQATHATPEEALRLLRQAEALQTKLGAEFPEYAPAKEVQARAATQLRAALLQHVRSRPPGEALTAFREMLAQFPGDVEVAEGLEQALRALRERGAEFVRRGQFAEAIAHLDEALSNSPGDGELLALKVRAAEDREKFQALDNALAIRESQRHGLAALDLMDKMLALCPNAESLAARHKQAAQAVEEARQQRQEGERLLRRGRFLKARRAFAAATKTCADDFQAHDGLGHAIVGCLATVFIGVGLVVILAGSGPLLLNRLAWARTQAAVQAAGADDAKIEQLYQAYLQKTSSTYDTAKVASERLAEVQQRRQTITDLLAVAKSASTRSTRGEQEKEALQALLKIDPNHAEAKEMLSALNERLRQAKIAELLTEAGTNNSMANARKGMGILKSLFEIDPNHAKAKALLAVLEERERERQAKIAELLVEARANNNLTNALKGAESLKSLFELDANHAEAKQLLPVLQQRESDRQAKIVELLAEAKTNANSTNALKGMEILKALFTLDATHAEAKQVLVVLQQEEQLRLGRVEELLASAKDSNNITNAWKGIASLNSLVKLDPNHAEAKQLLPLLQEQERRRQVRIAELFAEAKNATSMTDAWKGLASLKSLFVLDDSHPAAKQLLAILQAHERERQAKITALLTEAETNNSMANARKGMEILKSLFEIDASHPEAKQLLGLLQERERERLVKISELLAEAKGRNNIENAEKGLASLKFLLELDPNHAEAKQLLPLLQEQERRRQVRIAELLAEAKASPATSPKGMESLQALLKLDADNTEAKQLFVAFQERERERQRQAQIVALLATAKADFVRKDAKSAAKSLADLLKADSTNEEGRRLQKDFWRLASKASPWENSLGMRFVPVPGTKVMFSIWETRLQDFRIFRQPKYTPRFAQGHTEPVVATWNEAKAFCAWLTEKERGEGRLAAGQSYRLPTNQEWTAAVGSSRYPWGNQWPPPKDAGNYSPELAVDGFRNTSPVGSFKPNQYGIFDLGGNFWEWCEDIPSRPDNPALTVRGASFLDLSWSTLLSAEALNGSRVNLEDDPIGFRVVLVVGEGAR